MRVKEGKRSIEGEEIELLHQQFALLVEKSKDCNNEELIGITDCMIKIHAILRFGYYCKCNCTHR